MDTIVILGGIISVILIIVVVMLIYTINKVRSELNMEFTEKELDYIDSLNKIPMKFIEKYIRRNKLKKINNS